MVGYYAISCVSSAIQVDLLQITRILEARIDDNVICHDEVRSRPDEKCLVSQLEYQGRSYKRNLSYNDALYLPGGMEALRTLFQVATPSGLFPKLMALWEGLFRGRKSQSTI
jgi:hypothetical protein